ncbi:MAG TPA: VOC family protein [Thermomicrobiales bacterium]|nr:VOC family protein [Thermomicrobiales bacterium]
MAQITVGSIAIDCPDPKALATFYSTLLGLEMSGDDAFVLPNGMEVWFQGVENYQAPTWPTQERGQQMHFDLMVDDMDAAQTQVMDLGAKLVDDSPERFRVFLDPAGHPFCLCISDDGSNAGGE